MDLEKKDDEQYPLPAPPQAQKSDSDITEESRSPEILSGIPMTENAQNDMRSSGKLIGVIVGIVIFLILLIIIGVVGFFFFRGGVMERSGLVSDDSESIGENGVHADLGVRSAACKELISNGIMGEEIFESDIENLQKEINDALQDNGDSDTQLTVEESCLIGLISSDVIAAQESYEDVDNVTKKTAIKYATKYGMTQRSTDRSALATKVVLQHMVGDTLAASMRSIISSTVPGMILCMNDNGYVTEPKEGQEMCRGNSAYGVWPVLSDKGAKWGGCKMSVERTNGMIEHFTYCATMADGTIVTCEETGCDFDGDVNNDVDMIAQKNGTYADEQLTRDAMQGIVAKMALLGCDAYESHSAQIVTDMIYSSDDERTWTERWTVRGCDKTYPIDIVFTETRGQGTVWTIE